MFDTFYDSFVWFSATLGAFVIPLTIGAEFFSTKNYLKGDVGFTTYLANVRATGLIQYTSLGEFSVTKKVKRDVLVTELKDVNFDRRGVHAHLTNCLVDDEKQCFVVNAADYKSEDHETAAKKISAIADGTNTGRVKSLPTKASADMDETTLHGLKVVKLEPSSHYNEMLSDLLK